jgi:hypothetical protein
VVVDVEDVDRVFLGELVLVDADDDVLAGVDARLLVGGALLDASSWAGRIPAPWPCRPALDLLMCAQARSASSWVSVLHQVGAGPRIDGAGDAGSLAAMIELGVAGDAGREVGGQGDGFVEALVCSDWVPPNTAAMASRQVRATLL